MDTNAHSTGDAPLDLRPLPGSERSPAPGAVPAGQPLDPEQTITVTLVLRRRAAGEIGADPDDVATVTQTLSGLGLHVVAADEASRRVRVSGTIARLSEVFGTELTQAETTVAGGRTVLHRHRSGGLSVPADLDGIVTAVLGLDDRPQARSQSRTASAASVSTSYTPPQLGAIYGFPSGTDGAGQVVSIIELGGGFAQSELDTYFQGLGVRSPTVTAIGVDGADNQPGQDPQGADGEVLLDIEVAGALATGAEYRVYFAPNSDAGFLDAVSDAAHATPAPIAISISWGQSEDQWTAQARDAMDGAFADAAALGITVTAAAGDNGSSDGAGNGEHADFPASSPHVVGCGGTTLRADPSTSKISAETVWNSGASGGATGGGVSDTFPLPDWQSSAGVPAAGRGVPDVGGRRGPRDRVPRPRRRHVRRLWRHQRGRAAVGCAHRASRPGHRPPPRPAPSAAVPGRDPRRARRRLPRHHRGVQRRLLRRAGLGSLHRPRLAGRSRTARPPAGSRVTRRGSSRRPLDSACLTRIQAALRVGSWP